MPLKKVDMERNPAHQDLKPVLSAEDLLAGSTIVHEIQIPARIQRPGSEAVHGAVPGIVRLRPLSIATLTLISRAARDDAGLVPLLMIKESLTEPAMTACAWAAIGMRTTNIATAAAFTPKRILHLSVGWFRPEKNGFRR